MNPCLQAPPNRCAITAVQNYTPAAEPGCVLGLDWRNGLYKTGRRKANVGDTIENWIGVVNKATQATEANRPTLQSNGIASDGSNDVLMLGTALSFAGDFTVYGAFTRVTGNALCVLGGTGGASGNYVGIHYDNNAYVIGNGPSLIYDAGDAAGPFLARWRRRDNKCYFAATGVAEVQFPGTMSAAVNLSSVLARTSSIDPSAATSRFRHVWAYDRDFATDNPDANARVLDWLKAAESMGL